MGFMSKTPLAEILFKYRYLAGLSQQELANRAKTGRVHIAQIEAGTRENVTLDLLKRLAAVLGDDFGEEIRAKYLRGKRRRK